jgi:hypothetical protein
MSLLDNLLKPGSGATGQKIYATGFSGKDFAALPGLIEALDAVLIDIRFAPSAQPIRWSKPYLSLLLKKKYLHVPHLGSRAQAESGKFLIQNMALGIKIVREIHADVLLMCECEKAENCHRRFISDSLKGQGIDVREIVNWEDVRFYP